MTSLHASGYSRTGGTSCLAEEETDAASLHLPASMGADSMPCPCPVLSRATHHGWAELFQNPAWLLHAHMHTHCFL